jgi:hypothetical protein
MGRLRWRFSAIEGRIVGSAEAGPLGAWDDTAERWVARYQQFPLAHEL